MSQKPRTLEAALHLLADDVIATMGPKKAWILRDYPSANQAFNQLRNGIEGARMGWTQHSMDSTKPGVAHFTFESKFGTLQVKWLLEPSLLTNDEG